MDDLRPVDFSAVDPYADPARLDRAVASVVARASRELERRRSRTPLELLTAWAWPALVAAALVSAVSLAVLEGVARGRETVSRPGIAEVLGLPEPVTTLVAEERPPSTGDLLHAVEELK